MDMKKAGILGGAFVGSFLLLLVVMYFVYPYIHPQQVKKLEASADSTQALDLYSPEKYNPQAIDSLTIMVEDLQQLVDSLKNREGQYITDIDSLSQALEEQRTRTEEVMEQKESMTIATETKKKVDSETVTKSLLNLDVDSLSPIVNLLNDKQLVTLYESASSMQKEKLLRSLEPQKAATILKKVMS